MNMQPKAETSMNMKRQKLNDDKEEEKEVDINAEIQKSHLHDELIFSEILPKLPVKSLIRFQLVSQHWESQILSTEFAQIHLQRTAASPNFSADPSSRCVVFRKSSSLRILNYASYDNVEVRSSNNDVDAKLDEIEFPDLDGGSPFLIGSANGLVGVGVEYDDGGNNYLIYNPCTGDYFEADEPVGYAYSSPDTAMFFGFGYVSSLDDYKILIIEVPDQGLVVIRSMYVYSLRGDTWHSYRHPGSHMGVVEIMSNEGVLVHERLHYAVCTPFDSSSWGWSSKKTKKWKNKSILAFNLESEELNMVPLPYTNFGHDNAFPRDDTSFQLSTMDGCLCAWAKYRDGGIRMWMLKEYGQMDSWTKTFKMNMYEDWRAYPYDFFGFTSSGKVLMKTSIGNLMLDKVDLTFFGGLSLVMLDSKTEVFNFVASLVSPSSIAATLGEE